MLFNVDNKSRYYFLLKDYLVLSVVLNILRMIFLYYEYKQYEIDVSDYLLLIYFIRENVDFQRNKVNNK